MRGQDGFIMLQRFLLVWLTLLSVLAYLWPHWASTDVEPFASIVDPFVWTKAYLKHLFALTMFAIGCLLPRDEVRQVFHRWPTVLGGTALQYTLMPLLAYLIAKTFSMPDDLRLGIILVGCVPGAMASNVLTLTARGNVSYSVSLTTSATILSPLIVPAVLYFAVQQTDIDRNLLIQRAVEVLLLQVVGPVIAGHLLSHRFGRLERFMQHWGPTIANLTILWIIAVVVNANHQNLTEVGWQLAVSLLAMNLIGYLGGYMGAAALGTTAAMRRALTLEVGMQNAGLGAVLANQLFQGRDVAALPPALYTFGCMLTGTILAQFWSRRALDGAAVDEDSAKGD